MSRTPSEQVYSALHEDYSNGLLSRAEYEAAFRQLRPVTRRRRPLLIWLLALAVALILMAIYAAQIGAL